MRPFFLLVVLAVAVLLAVGVLVLGAFPPGPHSQPVQHVVPNDRFQSR